MTSMPASRSARAITLAPRSWPSSPGLATSTRIGGFILYVRRFLVRPEHFAQGIADLTQRGVCAYRIQDERHSVLGSLGGSAQRVEGLAHPAIIAPRVQCRQLGLLVGFGRLI